MDSPQSVVSPLKTTNLSVENTSRETESGALDVFIHQARDIHNICIYQKQDVYAKLCLTNDPEETVSTKIINGGGRNPVFNENMRLSVHKLEASLKCEIWMLSRVRNYLEDQLLGFALVPISQVLLHNGKLEKEFSLSSTDLFHSPAGFVHLSISYVGTLPEVIPIPAPAAVVESTTKSVPDGLDKIEFPDPKVVNENNQMVEEYISMPCTNSESLVSSDNENLASSEVVEVQSAVGAKIESNGTSSAALSFESLETPKDTKSANEKECVSTKDDSEDNNVSMSKTNGSGGILTNTLLKGIVPETEVVQQDIVDMYMKSMQQFTESLAKMKLPLDFESGPPSSENSSSDQKSPASKTSNSNSNSNSGSRVFYGSRAFF